MNKYLKWIIIIILAVLILVPEIFLGYFLVAPESFKQSAIKYGFFPEPKEEKIIDLDVDLGNGVKAKFSPLDADIITSVKVESSKLDEAMPKGLNIVSYDFSAIRDTTAPVELRLPFNKSLIKDTMIKECVFVAYYDENKRQYVPIRYFVDEEKSEVIIFAEHFRRYDVFVYDTKQSRDSSLNLRVYKAFSKFGMDDSIYYKVIENYIKSDSKEIDTSSINILIDYLGANKNIFRQLESAFDLEKSPALEDTYKAINNISTLLAMYELADDFRTGEYSSVGMMKVKEMQNLDNREQLKSIAKLSSIALIENEFSEDKLKKNVLNEAEEEYEKTYKLYYENKHKDFDINTYFYNRFLKAYNENISLNGNMSDFKYMIDKTLDSYAREFWYEEESLEKYYKLANKKDISKARKLNEEMKKRISENIKAELIKELMPVFDFLKIHITNDMYMDVLAGYRLLDEDLNKKITVEISEKYSKGEEALYKYGKFYIKPLAGGTNKKAWRGAFDEKGSAEIDFTVFKYLLSGAPNKIELYFNDTNPEIYPPDEIVSLNLEDNLIKIILQPERKVESKEEKDSSKNEQDIKTFTMDDIVGDFEGTATLNYAEIAPKASPLFKTRIDSSTVGDTTQAVKVSVVKVDDKSGVMNFDNFYITSPMDGSKIYTGINQIKFTLKNGKMIFNDKLADDSNPDVEWNGSLSGKVDISEKSSLVFLKGKLAFEGEMKIYGMDNSIEYSVNVNLSK